MKVLTEKSDAGKGYSIDSEDLPEAITKLGRIEQEAFDLISGVCDHYCKWPNVYADSPCCEDRLLEKCNVCPLDKLADLIYQNDRRRP